MKKISMLLIALFVLTFTSTPVSAASGIEGPNIIHKEANQVFTTMDLLSLYDLDVFVKEDYYTGYGNVPGEYSVILIQGSTTKNVTIVVVEKWGDLLESNELLYVADYKDIYVSSNRMLTPYEIIFHIYSTTGYVDTEYQFRYEELKNEYYNSIIDDTVPEGVYEYTFRLTYYTGNQTTNQTHIHVVKLPEITGVILEAPPSDIDKLMNAIPVIVGAGAIFYFLTHRKRKGGFKS